MSQQIMDEVNPRSETKERSKILSLKDLTTLLPGHFIDDPSVTADHIKQYVKALRHGREVEVKSRPNPNVKEPPHWFSYASPLTQHSTPEIREAFFAQVMLLIDRHPHAEARFQTLCLLAEMVAVEVDHQQLVGVANAHRDLFSFGRQALRTLREIMPTVVGIKEPFMRMVRRVLVDVIDGASAPYVLDICPILTEMAQDPVLGPDLIEEFFFITDSLVEAFALSLFVCDGTITSSGADAMFTVLVEGSADAPSERYRQKQSISLRFHPRHAFANIATLMSYCAKHPPTSEEYHKPTHRVSKMLIKEKLKLMKAHDVADAHCKECAVHRLMASMAMGSKKAADMFTEKKDPKLQEKGSSAKDHQILNSLIRDVRQIEDNTRGKKTKGPDHATDHDAWTLFTLNAILKRSEEARRILNKSQDINPNTFVNNLLKIAKNGGKGLLIAAAMEGLVTIAKSKTASMAKIRDVMEKECDVANRLQEIMRFLLGKIKTWDEYDNSAMQSCLALMQLYSKYKPDLSKQLNEGTEGFDRESIVFRLLKCKEDSVLDKTRLGAAGVLRVVPLEEFARQEIREVVNIAASLPPLASETMYDVHSNILFVLFRMAMDTGDGVSEDSVGSTFRDVYSTEVVQAVYRNLSQAMDGDMADPTTVNAKKRLYEMACVKFLQTAWRMPQLRDGLGSDEVVGTLVKVIKVEQLILFPAPDSLFTSLLHKHVLLDQTYVGYEIKNLIRCIECLPEKDIIAYRLYNTIANLCTGGEKIDAVLDALEESLIDPPEAAPLGTTEANQSEEEAQRLLDSEDTEKTDDFARWHVMPCGRTVEKLCELGRRIWPERLPPLTPKWHIHEAHADEALCFAWLQFHSSEIFYKIKHGQDRSFRDKIGKWQTLLKQSDPRLCHLIMRNDKLISGNVPTAADSDADIEEKMKPYICFCGGGPSRTGSADEAELYGFYINPRYINQREFLERQMLAQFSHEMFSRGFKQCVAWVNDREKALFENTNRVDSHGELSAKRVKDAEFRREEERKEIEVRRNKYSWRLESNVWKDGTSHESFLRNNGIETLVYFICKPDGVLMEDFDRSVIDDTLHTDIVDKLETFGGSLMSLLDERKGDKGAPKEKKKTAKEMMAELNSQGTSLPSILESQFRALPPPKTMPETRNKEKYPEAPPPEGNTTLLSFAAEPLERELPLWDLLLIGSEEENFLQTVSLGLLADANKRLSAVPEYPAMTPKPKAVVPAAAAHKHESKKSTDPTHLVRLTKKELASIRGVQLMALVAGATRSIHTTLATGSKEARRRALESIRQSKVLNALHYTMNNLEYGIRKRVADPFSDEYHIGLKYVRVLEEIIFIGAEKLKECLAGAELFQVVMESVVDILVRYVALINSRNQGDEDPLHRRRQLVGKEEHMLQLLTRVVAEMINEVSAMQFFSAGRYIPEIVEGNNKCRGHCLQLLFTSNTTFHQSLLTLLLYDQELDTGFDAPALQDDGAYDHEDKRPNLDEPETLPGHHRDLMRSAIKEIYGRLCALDSDFKYDFVHEFVRTSVQAELSLRPSFMQAVLDEAGRREFRVLLENACLSSGVFGDSEVILDHAFVDHMSLGSVKLLVLTNKAYYLSTRTYAQQYDPKTIAKQMDQFTHLDKFYYDRIIHLYRGLSPQLFAIESTRSNVSKMVDVHVDVFVNRTVGVSERLLEVISRLTQDDLAQSCQIISNSPHDLKMHFERKAFYTALVKSSFNSKGFMQPLHRDDKFARWKEEFLHLRLYTHAAVLSGKSFVPRVLVLLPGPIVALDAMGEKRTVSEYSHIISCTCTLENWSQRTSGHWDKVRNFLSVDEIVPLNDEMESIEWTETSKSLMVVSFQKRTFTAQFAGDTSRTMWRRALREVMSKHKSQWRASVLPDLNSRDKHSRKIV